METLTTNQALAAGGILGGMLATIGISALVFYVLLVIADWKIFTKAGIAGWKSLIPIYNVYLTYKLSGIKKWFWYNILVTVVCNLVSSLAGGIQFENGEIVGDPSALAVLATVVSGLFGIFIAIFANYKLAKAFKKGAGFTIGLIFLPSIFTLILGFGSAKYDKKVLND